MNCVLWKIEGQENVFDTSQPISQGLPYNMYSVMNLYMNIKKGIMKKIALEGNTAPDIRSIHGPSLMDYLHINLLYCEGLCYSYKFRLLLSYM